MTPNFAVCAICSKPVTYRGGIFALCELHSTVLPHEVHAIREKYWMAKFMASLEEIEYKPIHVRFNAQGTVTCRMTHRIGSGDQASATNIGDSPFPAKPALKLAIPTSPANRRLRRSRKRR